MSTSGSTNFSLVTNTIIDEAFDICGIGSEGESINADMYVRATRSLNLLVKTWQASGHLWAQTEGTVTLIADQQSYALATLFSVKPMRVTSVRRKVTSGGTETPLNEMSRQEYFDTPNKTSSSTPNSFYYDPQRATGTLYLWPVASAATAAAQTLNVTYLRRIEDFDGTADDADFPQEWLEALSYGLAARLALKYGIAQEVRAEITLRAEALKDELQGFDNEPASVMLQPDLRW